MTIGDYVTANGLVLPDFSTILADVQAEQKLLVDPNLDVTPASPAGQFNAPILAALRDAWEGVRIAYDGFNPNAAEDFLLAKLALLTGTQKAAATFSTLTATVTLTMGSTCPAGTIFAQNGAPAVQFITTADVTATTAGDYPAPCRATVTGPVACNAATLTVIVTPQSGLTAVTNALDAVLGHAQDTDPQLRVRREQELRASGNATVDAIQAKLEALRLADGSSPIIECAVVENTNDFPDAAGRPPHTFEALIYDGDSPLTSEDDTYAQTIWDSHPAGIPSYGTNSSGNAVDKKGTTRIVRFTRPTIRPVKVRLTIKTVPGYGGDAAVKAYALATFLAIRPKIGSSGVRSLKFVAFADVLDRGALGGVPGVSDVTLIELGFVGGAFAAANLVLAVRDMPTLDTSNVTVVIV